MINKAYKNLIYITVENGEDKEQIISKIRRVVGHTNLSVWTKPIKLAGNFKILELHERGGRVIKIDGPGFIIEKLFEHFF